jgi:hypothetical protein
MHETMRVREKPRMSVAKMGEYGDTSAAAERERIIRDQKYQSAFVVTRYHDTDDVVRRALLSGEDVRAHCNDGALKVAAKATGTDWSMENRELNLQAIEKFTKLYSDLGISKAKALAISNTTLSERLEGVRVTSRPLVLLREETRAGRRMGALLVFTRKGKRLSDRAGTEIAMLMARAMTVSGLIAADQLERRLCIVVDVFHDLIYTAPASTKMRMDNVRSSCREINARWPLIEPLRAA